MSTAVVWIVLCTSLSQKDKKGLQVSLRSYYVFRSLKLEHFFFGEILILYVWREKHDQTDAEQRVNS